MRFQTQGPAESAVDEANKAIDIPFLVGHAMPFNFHKGAVD